MEPNDLQNSLQNRDKMNPEEAIKRIGQILLRNKSGQLFKEVPSEQPLLRLFGVKSSAPIESPNYFETLRGSLGEQEATRLLPGEIPMTPEGVPFVSKEAYDQVMQASKGRESNRLLSPEESALTIGYWKEAAPALVPLAEAVVKSQGGLPEWLGKQGPSYRLKRSEFGNTIGFSDDGLPVEYEHTSRKFYVGGKETPANQVGRLLSKTKPQLTGEQINEVTNLLNSQAQLQEVKGLFDPAAVGPIQDRLLNFQQLTGIQLPDLQGLSAMTDDKMRFRTVLGSAVNDYIKAITGAQMSEPEARRIMRALPKAGSADEAFIPVLEEIMKITEQKLNNRLDVLETQDTVGISKLRELSKRQKENAPAFGGNRKIKTASDYMSKFNRGTSQ